VRLFLEPAKAACAPAMELLYVPHFTATNMYVTGKGTGYRYFGAARNLPGVKELFEAEKPKQVSPLARVQPPCFGSAVRITVPQLQRTASTLSPPNPQPRLASSNQYGWRRDR
jgi:hypothetical protein